MQTYLDSTSLRTLILFAFVATLLIILIHYHAFKARNPVVNVRKFGATGDGVTDDTEAIKRAFEACPDGGTVFFPSTPPGPYGERRGYVYIGSFPSDLLQPGKFVRVSGDNTDRPNIILHRPKKKP